MRHVPVGDRPNTGESHRRYDRAFHQPPSFAMSARPFPRRAARNPNPDCARGSAVRKFSVTGPREFWGTTETAFVRIKSSRKLLVSRLQNNGINFSGRSLVFGSFAQCINDVRSLARNFCAIVFPCFGNPLQNSLESRMTKSVFRAGNRFHRQTVRAVE